MCCSRVLAALIAAMSFVVFSGYGRGEKDPVSIGSNATTEANPSDKAAGQTDSNELPHGY